MKFLLTFFVFLLPFHALLVTYFKCKIGIDTNIIRFWKEIILIFLIGITIFTTLKRNKFKLENIYNNNYLLGTITAFIVSSGIYIFFPYFQIKVSGLLGFKYDVFFLLAFISGLYLVSIQKNIDNILKTVFYSSAIMLGIFLPWYLIGDISLLSSFFGYSSEVSTYQANSCIAFAQNVSGNHRFQASFGGPIRFSVFLVVFYFIYIGYIFHKELYNKKLRNILIIIPSILVYTAIFYSYSKTSFLGLLFGLVLFGYIVNKHNFKKNIPKKIYYGLGSIFIIGLIVIVWIKRNLFLHLGAILNRLENLEQSIDMFFYNPIGYGLGIAGPASSIGGNMNSSTWGATVISNETAKFLPENWYVQIILEQGILGLGLFVAVIIIIGLYLYRIVKKKKDYLSIGMFTSFIVLCFMANFTHAFEESATSYILFMILGAYIGINYTFPGKIKKDK